MHVNNLVPFLIGHVLEPFVAQDTSIVDEDCDSPKGIYCSFYDCWTVRSRRSVDNGLSSSCVVMSGRDTIAQKTRLTLNNLIDNLLSSLRTKIVDYDVRAASGEGQRVSNPRR